MNYKAIIFDMDGTITNSENLWDKATQVFLEAQKIELSPHEKETFYKHFAGFSLLDATTYLKVNFNLQQPLEALMQEYVGYSLALFDKEVRFVDGFLAFHEKLSRYNLKYGIATNADAQTLAATKRALALESLFGKHIYSIDDVQQQGKPKPDIYLHAASQLEIAPFACIAIEDTACGIQAAKAANMFCIGINSHGQPDRLHEADMIINGYHEINLEALLYKGSFA